MIKKILWVGLDSNQMKTDCAVAWYKNDGTPAEKMKQFPVFHFANTAEGVKKLASWLRTQRVSIEEHLHQQYSVQFMLALEPTGCYSTNLISLLKKAGMGDCICQVPTDTLVCFRQLIHGATKTDYKDAYLLALYGSMYNPDTRKELSEEYVQLRQFTRLRVKLVASATKFRNEMENQACSLDGEVIRPIMNEIDRQISNLEKQIETFLDNHPELNAEAKRMSSVPGMGIIVAATIMAEYGPCERFGNTQKVVRYAGLAPTQKGDGSSVKSASLPNAGSAIVRHMLYMASLTAQNRIPLLRDLSKRLEQLQPMQKRCAVMRELLCIIWSVRCGTEDYREYDPNTKMLKPLPTKRSQTGRNRLLPTRKEETQKVR